MISVTNISQKNGARIFVQCYCILYIKIIIANRVNRACSLYNSDTNKYDVQNAHEANSNGRQ